MSDVIIPIFEHVVEIPTRIGIDGKNAFELWLEMEGNEEKTFQDWVHSISTPAVEEVDKKFLVTDSITGTIYKWSIEVTNGVPSITLTEV